MSFGASKSNFHVILNCFRPELTAGNSSRPAAAFAFTARVSGGCSRPATAFQFAARVSGDLGSVDRLGRGGSRFRLGLDRCLKCAARQERLGSAGSFDHSAASNKKKGTRS